MRRRRNVLFVAITAALVGMVHCGGSTLGDDRITEAGVDTSEGGAGDGSAADRDDGDSSSTACPESQPGERAACTTESKACTYCRTGSGSSGLLGTFCDTMICKGGAWKLVPRVCDCGATPPVAGTACFGNTIGCTCEYDGCGPSRRKFTCQGGGLPPATWIERDPAVPCDDAGK